MYLFKHVIREINRTKSDMKKPEDIYIQLQ